MRSYASFHGWAPAWTLARMKSSCGRETPTPGWTNVTGAAWEAGPVTGTSNVASSAISTAQERVTMRPVSVVYTFAVNLSGTRFKLVNGTTKSPGAREVHRGTSVERSERHSRHFLPVLTQLTRRFMICCDITFAKSSWSVSGL